MGLEPTPFLPTNTFCLARQNLCYRLLVQANTPGFRFDKVATPSPRLCLLLNTHFGYA